MEKSATSKFPSSIFLLDLFSSFLFDNLTLYRLPSKYPENFALCSSYVEGRKEIPLAHRDKVGSILRDAYNALKPIIKYRKTWLFSFYNEKNRKFRLSLGLLIESPVRNKGVAWTKKIKIDFSMPGVSGSRK